MRSNIVQEVAPEEIDKTVIEVDVVAKKKAGIDKSKSGLTLLAFS